MKRRDFLTASGAMAAGVAAATVSAPAIASGTHQWKMVTSWPKGLPGPGVSADRLAERVAKMSGGRFIIKVYGAGELVPALGVQEAVESGTAELYHSSGSYFGGRNIGHSFFCVVPFGADINEFNAWLRFGGGQALWDELTEPRGFKCFTGGGSGIQTAGWFNREINSLDDLQGLNFRITGLGALVMKKLGVNPVSMAPGDIFPALQSGALDGAEWVGPTNDLAFGFHKVLNNMYAPSFSDIHGGAEWGVNSQAFEKLPAEFQLILTTAMEAETELLTHDIFYSNIQSLDKLRTAGVNIGTFPDDVWDGLRTAAHEVMEETRASSDLVARIHDSFFNFTGQAVDYRKLYDQKLYAERAKYFA